MISTNCGPETDCSSEGCSLSHYVCPEEKRSTDSWKMSRDVDRYRAKMECGGHGDQLLSLSASKSSVGGIVRRTPLFIFRYNMTFTLNHASPGPFPAW